MAVLGCGYLGSHFAEKCAQAGARVWALTRNPATAEKLARLPGLSVVRAELAGTSWHSLLPSEIDLGVDCVGSGAGGLEGYRASYFEGMRSISLWLAAARVRALAYTGTTAVYPANEGQTVDESSPVVAAGMDTREGLLRATEETLREAAARHGVSAFVFRMAGLYGPGRHRFLDLVREGGSELPGEPSHRLNLIHRDDAARALAASASLSGAPGCRFLNLCDDHPAARSEVAAWVASRLGLSAPSFSGAASAERTRGSLDRAISNAAVKRLLGWAPLYPSYREGYEPLLAER